MAENVVISQVVYSKSKQVTWNIILPHKLVLIFVLATKSHKHPNFIRKSGPHAESEMHEMETCYLTAYRNYASTLMVAQT